MIVKNLRKKLLVFGFMLHLPFAFSFNNKALSFTSHTTEKTELSVLENLYEKLELSNKGLSSEAFEHAIKGFLVLKEKGEFLNNKILSIVDFTKPSTQKRLYVIDLENEKVLFNTYVSHGRGSGQKMAETFSNTPESFQSSLGFYETKGTYDGKNGYSMKLCGLEKGFNNKAEDRAIVMHGADYVSEKFIRSTGYLGRSWGCPALPQELNKPVIEKIKGGTCFFIYSHNNNYLSKSKVINA